MEEAAPELAPEFYFRSSTAAPVMSAPSSPKCFAGDPFDFYHYYITAPTSPAATAAAITAGGYYWNGSSSVPFDWEENPGTPKFSGQLESPAPAPTPTPAPTGLKDAGELLEEERIRPLKLPPRLHTPARGDRIPISPRRPRRVAEELDPFAMAMREVTKEGTEDGCFDAVKSLPAPASIAAMDAGGGRQKWRLRNMLLFRTAFARAGSIWSSSSSSSLSVKSLKTKKKGFGGEESRSSSFESEEGTKKIKIKNTSLVPFRRRLFSWQIFNPTA
ncbi:hypothetical protein AXF42_Ash015602 [Apostasia shenzhenica]|uniref:Uncharacterized protein n=1 Tax=Apostasia shenzhenica TaxID=1088818 RepID=A0A2I0AKP4_9ASPA|nr:hypothetical protein AXF42_Ash015602 [Apostasia shenzhenica]